MLEKVLEDGRWERESCKDVSFYWRDCAVYIDDDLPVSFEIKGA